MSYPISNCPICFKAIPLHALGSHLCDRENLTTGTTSPTSDPKYPCKYQGCKEKFYHLRDLQKHNFSHTNKNLYQCQHCEKTFCSTTGLRQHTFKKHSYAANNNTKPNPRDDTLPVDSTFDLGDLSNIESDLDLSVFFSSPSPPYSGTQLCQQCGKLQNVASNNSCICHIQGQDRNRSPGQTLRSLSPFPSLDSHPAVSSADHTPRPLSPFPNLVTHTADSNFGLTPPSCAPLAPQTNIPPPFLPLGTPCIPPTAPNLARRSVPPQPIRRHSKENDSFIKCLFCTQEFPEVFIAARHVNCHAPIYARKFSCTKCQQIFDNLAGIANHFM